MAETYDRKTALQAVCAALLYGEFGIGRDAERTDGGEIRTYSGLTVRMSKEARDLLAEAQGAIGEHGAALGMYDGLPLTTRDIERAIAEHVGSEEA